MTPLTIRRDNCQSLECSYFDFGNMWPGVYRLIDFNEGKLSTGNPSA